MLMAAKKKQIKYEFKVFKGSYNPTNSTEPHQGDYSLTTTTQPFVYSEPSIGFNLSQDEQFPKLSKNPVLTAGSSSRKAIEQPLLFHSPLTNETKLTALNNKNNTRNLYTDILITPTEETTSSVSNNQHNSNNNQSISPLRSGIDSLKITEPIIPDSSGAVYLAGMAHSENPPGLIPRFSSWTLISIGKSSLYNPHTGLSQPGFLPNHNFLIPWDIVINRGQSTQTSEKQQQPRGNRSGQNIFKKKSSEPFGLWSTDLSSPGSSSNASSPISVRTYIGMEYECPCGHRFICSGPDRIVKVSTQGNVKVAFQRYSALIYTILFFDVNGKFPTWG